VLREAAAALRTTPSELPARIVNLVEERRRLERELSEARRALANAGPSARSTEKRIGDIAFDSRVVDGVPGRELKSLADDLKRRIEEASKYCPLDQLALSPQCGFASVLEGNKLSVADEVAKLKLIVDVSREVWGTA